MTMPNQVIELAMQWTTSREKLMSEWLNSLRSAQTTGSELWEHTLDQIQSTVEETLSTEGKALRDWGAQLSGVEGASDELKKRVDEGVSLFTKWNEQQATVWRQWLETLRKSDLNTLASATTPVGEQVIKAWEEAGKQMIKAQKDWLNQWKTSE
jgi:hypothetical protein